MNVQLRPSTIHFTSSESFMDFDEKACEHAEVEAVGYVECTYSVLRIGPDGKEIAHLIEDAWELPDGRRFSDWAVNV